MLSAVSPEWLHDGDDVRVRDGATEFGRIDFDLHINSETEATMTLQSQWRTPPSSLVMHLPWFMETTSVRADGKRVPIARGMVQLPPTTKTVVFTWRRKTGTPLLSYQNTVDSYKAEYRKRYEKLLRDGMSVRP